MTIKTIEGDCSAGDSRFALVVARWNGSVVERLKAAAIETLRRHGVSEEHITVICAPGAFEIPLVCRKAASSGNYDAIVALGAVIRGGTPHFEYVAGECARGLSDVMGECGLPVAFGVLTVDTIEQAIERSGGEGGAGIKGGNKGEEAALAALEMVSLLRKM